MQLQRKSKSKEAFFFALLAAAIIYLPFIIYNGGYFIYYGDFNVQQIPFYKLAHEAVRSGDIFWSWHTDLGANFIGSYSFYLLGSPFFWLTLPFPTSWVPYLMGPLLVLKTACAALTAHLFLRRFVNDENYALIGSMLYAFSGWMLFNVFFNHFLDVAAFFPLLLLGVEKLVTENKKGLFAVAVLLNALVNYWFFVGEAVFVVFYVLLRATDRDWGLNLKKFLQIALEALLGFGAAAFIVLPSALALMGNPRTGGGEMLTGWNIWLYWHEQRYPAIIQSLLFPPELPARPNFFPDHGAKWASLSAWLPLFSITGVLAYVFRHKRDWLKKMLGFSLVCALVPALNSMFILFNHSFYARWYFMPILLMALATVRALEDTDPELGPKATDDYARSIKITAVLLVIVTVMSGLTPHYSEEGELLFGLADNPPLMWIFSGIALVCLAATTALVILLRKHPRFSQIALAGVLVVSVGFSIFYIANGKNTKSRDQWLIDNAIEGRELVALPESEDFGRVDFYDSLDNLGMYWHMPTIQTFHSIVPPSIMDFYPQVGVTRDVGSRPEAELYALRALLSVKWLYVEEGKVTEAPMPGFFYHSTQNGFDLYENEHFLPIGFAYDHYITESELEDFITVNRSHAMLRAIVLDDEAAERHSDILMPLDNEGYLHLNERTLEEDVDARSNMAAGSIEIDRTGFTIPTRFGEDELMFISVPYEAGWSATITSADGEVRKAPIEKANIGFMAVRVPAGEQIVRFSYETPGLTMGLIITGVSLLLLAIYLLICTIVVRRNKVRTMVDAHAGAEMAELLPDGDSPQSAELRNAAELITQPAPTEPPVQVDPIAPPVPTESPVQVDPIAPPVPTEPPVQVDPIAPPVPTEPPVQVDPIAPPVPTEPPVQVGPIAPPVPTEPPVPVDPSAQLASTEPPVPTRKELREQKLQEKRERKLQEKLEKKARKERKGKGAEISEAHRALLEDAEKEAQKNLAAQQEEPEAESMPQEAQTSQQPEATEESVATKAEAEPVEDEPALYFKAMEPSADSAPKEQTADAEIQTLPVPESVNEHLEPAVETPAPVEVPEEKSPESAEALMEKVPEQTERTQTKVDGAAQQQQTETEPDSAQSASTVPDNLQMDNADDVDANQVKTDDQPEMIQDTSAAALPEEDTAGPTAAGQTATSGAEKDAPKTADSAPAPKEKPAKPVMQAGLKRDARLNRPPAARKPAQPQRRDPRTGKPIAGPRRDPRTGKPLPPRRDPKTGPKV